MEYWKQKIETNKTRDIRQRIELRDMGWHVIQVWECQLKKDMLDTTLKRIEHTLMKIYLSDFKCPTFHQIAIYYSNTEEQIPMAAEEKIDF